MTETHLAISSGESYFFIIIKVYDKNSSTE